MTTAFKWLRAVAPGEFTGVHTDRVFLGRGSHRLLTAWIPLGDCPVEQARPLQRHLTIGPLAHGSQILGMCLRGPCLFPSASADFRFAQPTWAGVGLDDLMEGSGLMDGGLTSPWGINQSGNCSKPSLASGQQVPEGVEGSPCHDVAGFAEPQGSMMVVPGSHRHEHLEDLRKSYGSSQASCHSLQTLRCISRAPLSSPPPLVLPCLEGPLAAPMGRAALRIRGNETSSPPTSPKLQMGFHYFRETRRVTTDVASSSLRLMAGLSSRHSRLCSLPRFLSHGPLSVFRHRSARKRWRRVDSAFHG